MHSHTRRSGWPLGFVSFAFMIGGCATTPDVPLRSVTDEGRHATQLMQEREQGLAALRAEMAATRIAAAKQEAEVHELRATVLQLRQENGEAHQALLEAKRTLNARETEVVAMKTERDQLAQASVQSGTTERHLTALQETVASLSQRLTELKSAMALAKPTPADSAERQDRAERIIPAVHILQEGTDQSKLSWTTVQPGDSWWSLARKFRTTMHALRAINGRSGDHLNVGEAIRLP